jgi:hypothetical protein
MLSYLLCACVLYQIFFRSTSMIAFDANRLGQYFIFRGVEEDSLSISI